VALTVSLATETLHLVGEKLLRCAAAAGSGPCAGARCAFGTVLTEHARSVAGEGLRAPLPLGFQARGAAGRAAFVERVAADLMPHAALLLHAAADGDGDVADEQRLLEHSVRRVAATVYEQWRSALPLLEQAFAGANEHVPFGERQLRWDELFKRTSPFDAGRTCHAQGFAALFADYEAAAPDEFSAELRRREAEAGAACSSTGDATSAILDDG